MNSSRATDRVAFSDLKRRVLTGAIAGVVVLLLLLSGILSCAGRWVVAVAALLIVGGAAIEAALFSRPPREVASSDSKLFFNIMLFVTLFAPALVAAGGLLSAACGDLDWSLGGAAAGVARGAAVGGTLFFTGAAFLGRRSLEAVSEFVHSAAPLLLLVGGGGAALVSISLLSGGAWSLLWLIVVVCSNDIAAYFAGSTFKGPKLSPALSPNKTVSGAAAGLLTGVVVGWLAAQILPVAGKSGAELLFPSVAVVINAQLGDLIKSYSKRLSGVKDSGSLLPGHGGILDRIDGVLGAAPFMLLWVLL